MTTVKEARSRDALADEIENVSPPAASELFSPERRSDDGVPEPRGDFSYRRLWRYTVFLTLTVALAPLIIMTVINYVQYQNALRSEMIHPTSLLLSNGKRSLEFFIAERLSALRLVVRDRSLGDMCEQEKLERAFRNLNDAFGGFVDLGLIDANGRQCAYNGPYALIGKEYRDQDWFHEVNLRGEYVSDVFTGYRDVPHFVIAVRNDDEHGHFRMLRATVSAELLARFAVSLDLKPSSDAFIISRKGVLQTPSRFNGEFLKTAAVAVPPFREESQVVEQRDGSGRPYVLGYAYIARSPFILVMLKRQEEFVGSWLALRGDLVGFLVMSIVLILIVVLWSSTAMVNRLRRADLRRAEFVHNIEYTSKMASIGRLAAGVAHEINNPLAIINEKAGLMKDLVLMTENFPRHDQFLKTIRSITGSVERCSAITHRLLGFAKRMDVKVEMLGIEELLHEVLSFLGKEAEYRNVVVEFHVAGEIPAIESDRGQLQQVFLNIINNAFAAVSRGGRVDIWIEALRDGRVQVRIQDDGHGIHKEDLPKIFEPFFTTKKEYGTGLGLSITYGIVQKLGGQIGVESEVGKGTCFTVTLPRRATG